MQKTVPLPLIKQSPATSGITLDDNTGDAKVIFAEDNSVTITGTIDGASSDEGTIQITGATKTFASAIGGTQALTLIDIDNTSTFNEAISATNINVADSITATFKANTTFTTTTLGSNSVFYVGTAATPASIVINGSIVGSSDGVGTVQVTNSGGNGTLFLGGKLGTSSNSLALLDVDATTILQGDNANVTNVDGVYQLTIADITTIDIAASTELEIKYSVVTSTIDLNGSSTLTVQSSPQLYNSSFAQVTTENGFYGGTSTTTSIQGNITNSGDNNTLTIWSPLYQAVAQPTTFAGTVNVDIINIATTNYGGYAIFTGSGGVTAGSVVVTGGNHADEDNLGVFNYSLTTTTIVLNKDSGDATIEFTGNNTSTITGTINGSNATEGILKVTGSGKTFSDAIGTTRSLTLIDIDESVIFTSAVVATVLTMRQIKLQRLVMI
jgi:hypothetical protein